MKKIALIISIIMIIPLLWSCKTKQKKVEMMQGKFKSFILDYDNIIIPLYKNSALTSWNANITGKEEDLKLSEKASFELEKVYTDARTFSELKAIKESKAITDPIQSRELELIYNMYLGGQIDTAMISARLKMETEINKKYLNFRAKIDGKEVGDNKIEEILRTSVSNKELQGVWEAHKLIGPVVAEDIIRLVRQRNLIATKLGFSNYHDMSLRLSGQDPAEVTAIFDELDNLTKDAFAGLKNDIDNYYAKRYNIKVADLRPWHYQNRYFQEAPQIYTVDFDKYYKNQDPAKLAATYYDGLGLNVDAIIAKSDLYEKPGKNQHAFSTDIDREGDVRTLDNITSSAEWMGTILHELGHGVYSYYNDKALPFTLRTEAHTFTTEAIAELFGRFATNPAWMQSMGIIDEKEAGAIAENAHKALRLQMLVFSRWAQVMYRFEKAMYENPDQDLNKTWWDLVSKYQLLTKPDGRNMPDWATKVHVALYPCYYHNYLLGEVLASQMYSYVETNVTKNPSFTGDKAVGTWFREKIFMPGSKYYWNEMIEKATGEKLTAKYYAEQFVK